MTLLKKIIIRYTLITLFTSSFVYTVKLYGQETQIKWGLSARQGCRDEMEDRHSVQKLGDLYFFGVYDGHGGDNAAEFVKNNLVENFLCAKDKTIKQRLTSAFLTTDENFLTCPEFEDDRSGTTAVVATVDANTNKLFIANTGDSRAIVVRDGKVLLDTKDHKPGEVSEYRRITKAKGSVFYCGGCFRVNKVLAVSRAIGDRDLKKWVIPDPDVMTLGIEENEILVLACDGLWHVMKNEEVAAFVHEKFNEQGQESLATHDSVKDTGKEMVEEDGDEQIKSVARALRDEAYNKKSTDNISVLVVKLGLS